MPLSALTHLITDGKHGDCVDQLDSSYYFISAKDVRDGKINYKEARQITRADFEDTHRRTKLEPNDILITNSGTIGRMAIVQDSELTRRTTFQKSVAIIKPNKRFIEPKFLYYTFLAQVGYLVELSGGTAQKNLLLGDLRHFKVRVPHINAQQKIAAILSAYDDLIENNKRRIALLEKMAEEIYREWFVRMRFPGHEKVKVIKGIPYGWEVKKLGELTRTQYGYTASAETEGEGPKFLRITDIVPAAIDWELVPHCKIEEKDEVKYLLSEGDIVVARTGATVGYAKRINKRHPNTVFASYLVRLIPKRKSDSIYLGLSVERNMFKDFIWMFVTGAAQPQANASTMALFPVLYPPESLLREFNRIAESILDEKELLLNQVTIFSRTRDFLLPRLISGKLSVEKLDIQFSPSMRDETENAEKEAACA